MNLKRVIPVLLLKNDELYKTVRFKNPRYVGDPINAVKIFNEKEVDELMILDIDATPQGREPNYALLREIASESFIPMCYGGGIRNIEMFKTLVNLGYERLSINSGFYENSKFVAEAVKRFGSSAIIIGIDYRTLNGKQIVFTDSGRKNTRVELSVYVKNAVEAGAGEIFLNSIDRDGTYSGLDLETAEQIANLSSVPVIICGGASSVENLGLGLHSKVSAVAAGSLFVFYGKLKAVLINYPDKNKFNLLTKDE